MKTNGANKETCLKPVGELAQVIEALPMNNFLQFMVNLSKLSVQQSILGEFPEIGKND